MTANFNSGSMADLLGNMPSTLNVDLSAGTTVGGMIRFNDESAHQNRLFLQQNKFLQHLGAGIKIANNSSN